MCGRRCVAWHQRGRCGARLIGACVHACVRACVLAGWLAGRLAGSPSPDPPPQSRPPPRTAPASRSRRRRAAPRAPAEAAAAAAASAQVPPLLASACCGSEIHGRRNRSARLVGLRPDHDTLTRPHESIVACECLTDGRRMNRSELSLTALAQACSDRMRALRSLVSSAATLSVESCHSASTPSEPACIHPSSQPAIPAQHSTAQHHPTQRRHVISCLHGAHDPAIIIAVSLVSGLLRGI
jgi:hypothetical protein